MIIKGLELPASGQQIALFFPYLGHAMGILRLTKVSQDHVRSDLTLFPSWGLWNALGQGRRLPSVLMAVRKDHFLLPWVHTSAV